MAKLVVGKNDLATLHPEIAAEADGWDPTSVTSGSSKDKKKWRCKKYRHAWETTVKERTGNQKRECPYCANQKLLVGFNDLKTKFPEIAAEADGWDPSKVKANDSTQRFPWKCKKGHIWETTCHHRSNGGTGCPVCSHNVIESGFNDLKTRYPEIASEADGWDPSKVMPGNMKKFSWKCKEGHTWKTSPNKRTNDGSGCPICSLSRLVDGVNDLKTRYPEIASEADGWDPSKVVSGTHKKMPWKCNHGHVWKATVNSRTSNCRGCPYCTNRKVWIGFNDLKTRYPEIALEADGWDPESVTFGTTKKMLWKCEKGHSWDTKVVERTTHARGCPYCAGQKVWVGFNDLKTRYPEIALEADGWDPSTVTPGSSTKKRKWKCPTHGHTWEESPQKRCVQGDNCPFCSNKRVLKGFNDLKTKFPDIASEADGWDPSTVTPGSSNQKRKWKCKKCLKSWNALVKSRTSRKSGCPRCTASGFNPGKPAWFYLMKRENEQQIGITNFINDRLKVHRSEGWILVDKTTRNAGQEVLDTETLFRQWLKKKIGLVPNKLENWYITNLEVQSLAELKEKSGIETSIF